MIMYNHIMGVSDLSGETEDNNSNYNVDVKASEPALQAGLDVNTQPELETSLETETAIEPEKFVFKTPVTVSALNGLVRNFNDNDSRVPIGLHEDEYDAVIAIGDYCTGTIVDVEGYDVLGGGTVISTSGHCVENDNITNPNITITGNYLSEDGRVEYFNVAVSQIWMHPHYKDFDRNVDMSGFMPRDSALLYSPNPVPDGVKPLPFVPKDMTILPDYQKQSLSTIQNAVVSAVGYSRDVVGLHAHNSCLANNLAGVPVLKSDCHMGQGASGGPLFLELKDRSIVIGTNTAVAKNGGFHTALREEFLSVVPFLEEKHGGGDSCTMSGHVEGVEGLSVRYEPDSGARSLSTVPVGEKLEIHKVMADAAGKKWGFVTDNLGKIGYAEMDSISLHAQPKCMMSQRYANNTM